MTRERTTSTRGERGARNARIAGIAKFAVGDEVLFANRAHRVEQVVELGRGEGVFFRYKIRSRSGLSALRLVGERHLRAIPPAAPVQE